MADVFDRPMFQKNATERMARERLKKLGNIQDYASEGMFGVGGTMEDTGLRYQQPFGYSEGQVDPGILGAVRQRDMRGSQIVQGGDLTAQDVPMLMEQRNAAMQSIKDAQLSSDPNKYEAIDQLKNKILDIDQKIEVASKITERQDVSARDFSGMNATPKPMGPGEMDIFQSISERAAAENLKQKPPVFGGAPDQKPVVTAAEAQVPKDAQGVQKGPTGMEAEVLGRKGSITPADVAAGLNDPKPEVREKTAADFAKQFADMGPKYEGIDKGLLLAQIGFAIAAGESPNAMSNIANGLLSGSDMMIKDKQAKNEFDRQIQLAAMQYGLAEEGKARDRSSNPLKFVALEDTTYKGKKVMAGDAIYIPYGDIEKNGGVVPSGFGDTEMITAIAKRQENGLKILEDTYKQGLIEDTFLASQTDKYGKAASSAMISQRGLEYLENAMLKVADGEVTGLNGTLQSVVSKVAAAAGLQDVAKQFDDREEFISVMGKAFQTLIPAGLGGVQSANSISDRDVELFAKAYAEAALQDGVFSLAFVTEDKLLNTLKSAVDVLELERQRALTDMSGVEKSFEGRFLRSGDLQSPVDATTALDPYRKPLTAGSSTPSSFGNLSLGNDGVYELIFPER